MLTDFLNTVIATVQGMNPWLVAGIAFLGLLLETSLLVGFLVPGDATLLVTATSVTSFEHWLLLVLASILGALCGESIGYALGRWLGPALQNSWVGRKAGSKNWRRAENYLRRRGGIAVFISRFLPVLHSLVPVTAGMVRMPYRTFISWTTPACVLWSISYVSVGALATASYQQLGAQLHFGGFVFAGIIMLFAIAVWCVKRWLARRVEADG